MPVNEEPFPTGNEETIDNGRPSASPPVGPVGATVDGPDPDLDVGDHVGIDEPAVTRAPVTLQRRAALDYHLSEQKDFWAVKLFEAATPGLTFLRNRYDRSWLSTDAMAGLAVAAYLIPQVMAYSAIVGVPPVTGLWASVIAMVVYAAVGTSRVLSVGPESTIALMAGLSVAEMSGGDPARVMELSAALSLVVAGWCLVGRVFRLGVIADLLSQPLLVGYLAGAAALMVAGQLGKLTRTEVEGESIVAQFSSFADGVADTHLPTLAVGLVTLAAILIIHKFRETWPAALIGVVGAIVAYIVLDLGSMGVEVVGRVPSGLPAPRLPRISGQELTQLVAAGLGVTIMAYSDNMLFARGFPPTPLPGEQPSDREVDPQDELAGLGVVHFFVGLFGGFPVSSSGSRTALAVAARARTQVYSLVAAACVLVVLIVAGEITTYLPKAALGAVVVYAASKLFRIDRFIRLFRFRRREFALATITFVGTMVYGILFGVGLAVLLSLLEMGQRLARPRSAVLGRVPGVPGMHNVADYSDSETLPGLIIYRYDAPLFFANIGDLRRKIQRIVDQEFRSYPNDRLNWFLLNVEAATEIDITACDGLKDIHEDLAAQEIRFGLVRIKRELYEPLDRVGVIDLIGDDMLFPTLPVAEEAYKEWVGVHGLDVDGLQNGRAAAQRSANGGSGHRDGPWSASVHHDTPAASTETTG